MRAARCPRLSPIKSADVEYAIWITGVRLPGGSVVIYFHGIGYDARLNFEPELCNVPARCSERRRTEL